MIWMLKIIFAGLGSIFLHYGILAILIVALVLLEVFSSVIGVYVPFLAPLLAKWRKDMLWLAAILGFGIVMMWVGTHDEAKRCSAQTIVVKQRVDAARKDAVEKPRTDKWDTNQ